MKKWLNKKNILSCLTSVILALEVLLLIDAVVVFLGETTSIMIAAAIGAGLTVLFFFLSSWIGRQLKIAVIAVPVLLGLVTALGVVLWKNFSEDVVYQCNDQGKGAIYADRKVMLIVPHQDDDLNILGGVLEEYAGYGSDLYPVFVTNGDYYGLTEKRYQEAIDVFETMGVPAEQVIFLGYGDSWDPEGTHIYNAEPGEVMTSYFGRTETYGAAVHPAYREGRTYTIDHLMEDLRDVILEHRPDVIFCSDYDHHIDHKSTTLLFEKVMGNLLKENPDYRPVVYKAYAYGTAWEAEPDFYKTNISSTQNLFGGDYRQEPEVYRWEDRVRFPVKGADLSRSLVTTEGYRLLNLYTSQDANWMAAAVVNADKVAWQRHTDSLALMADIQVSSGIGSLLNDFMLIDNSNLADEEHKPYDGVWIPDENDDLKQAAVKLAGESDVFAVVLYDHPSEEHNVLNALIRFEDGTQQETGPLDPGGAATMVSVNKEKIRGMTIELKEVQGELAGLSEIEIFSRMQHRDGSFVKLMDEDENFLYDYILPADGQAVLKLYTFGEVPEVTAENYAVEMIGGRGETLLENGMIYLSCPSGEQFELKITCHCADVSDSIVVRNPGGMERRWINFWQNAEEAVFIRYSRADQKKLLIFSIPEKISYVIRHMI